MADYKVSKEGLEVLLLALQIFEKYGYKYPSIVKEEHYKLANLIQTDLLLIGVEDEREGQET
tara:strand:+ start:6908 stop:7093 length:186 start_codon:yes stop_codon:yes gene_type:complete